MKKIFTSILLFIVTLMFVNAQEMADTIQASISYEKARSLMIKGRYKKAEIDFRKAADVYKKAEEWEKYVTSINMISACNWRIGQFREATEIINTALEEAAVHLPKDNLKLADFYVTLGIISAITGKFDSADENYKLALEIKTKKLGNEHIEVARLYNNIGILQSNLWNYESAIEYHERALSIRKSTHGEVHNDLYSSYDNLAFCFIQKQDIDKALEYSLRAIAIGVEVHGKEHPRMSTGYNTLAIIYTLKRDFDKSLEIYLKALVIDDKINDGRHLSAAIILGNVGRLYMQKGEYDKAINYFNQELKIYLEVLGEMDPRVAASYTNIGEALNLKKEFKEASQFHKKAIKIKSKVFGENHMEVAESYNQLGISLNGLGNYESLQNFQKALIANVTDFNDSSYSANPAFTKYLDITTLLMSLKLKAETLVELYKKNEQASDLELALETYILCDRVIDKNRQIRLRYKDKLRFSKISKEVYAGAIEASTLLSQFSDSEKFNNQAFYFVEKSKSATLYENLSNSYAKKFTGLPESLIANEQNLKSKKSYLQSLVKPNQANDTTKSNVNQSKLFDINQQLDSISIVLERDFPKYYQLKYQNNTISPKQTQNKLAKNQAFIEYFEGGNMVYIFAITQDQFWIESFVKDSIYLQSMDDFADCFGSKKVQGDFGDHFPIFIRSSNLLYQKLIEPVLGNLSSDVDHLIIVPSDKLSYIPMELLVIDNIETSKNKDYKSLNYLLNNYSISYSHSANLLFQDIYTTSKASKSVLAFAPSYQANGLAYANLRSSFQDELLPLKWNSAEIQEISQYFKGTFKKESEATEASFKANAGNHNILHLAMHAFVDDEDPMQSKLLFYQDGDSIEDGMLHTYELFNMDLSAEMVVLSACRTGLGKLQVGEGMMSLGRAFAYAGCPSVVSSYWSVDDQSTSELMASFYKNIAEGMSKDKAMQKSKIDFLANTNGQKTHPYYWGGFVVLGNTEPISRSNYSLLIYLLTFIVLSVSIYLLYRKKQFSLSK